MKTRYLLPLLAVTLTTAGTVSGDHPEPGPHQMTCSVSGFGVLVEWDVPLGVGETVKASLFRDGELLADLQADQMFFRDEFVEAGPHTYRMEIVRVNEGPGDLIAEHECTVESPALQCDVFGGGGPPPQILIHWRPLDSDSGASGIHILRDGELIAELPTTAFTYEGEPSVGTSEYCVVAAGSDSGPDGRPVDDVLIGCCEATLVIPNFNGFIRGDCNVDGAVDISDALCVLFDRFVPGSQTTCASTLDADDSGAADVADIVFLLEYLFRQGSAPPSPFPNCGEVGSPDIDCDSNNVCFFPPP